MDTVVVKKDVFVKPIKETKERNNVSQLRLISSGGTPPDNWLLNLKPGTVFIVKDKQERSNFMLLMLEVISSEPTDVKLWHHSPDNPDQSKFFGMVEPLRFTARFDYVRTVEEPKQEE